MEIDVAGKLFPNITTIIVQLLATGFMLFLFKKFFWKPVQEYFDKRAAFIEGTINDAKNIKLEAKRFNEESKKQSSAAAHEYRNIVEQAKIDAVKIKENILAEASKESQVKMKEAIKEIEKEKLAAEQQMKEEIVTIAMDVATKLMNEQMNEKVNQQLIKKFVEELEANGKDS